ncbi:pyridoxal phosphate-dependent aminotransferase [Bifidobacterium simiarum]|uniref:Aminotransferase n=1 Tax=Bifidobacterium simiarum TaxID=2045441 RepID=A0A2M9HD47_9BIFI|nr:pyridoxal phosphate-dependent aminotransferase [Bifidobacterium simiarum]MBT1166250.1 pyridoxal phosphate-dependent aminotransferase [Bifidobacterium simiarum]PJM74738.1 aspartate aminotransferase [Bifidobacterium simiarum]
MPHVSHRAQEALYPSVREMFELAAEEPGAISFAIGEPGFDTPRPMINAAYEAAVAGDTHYTPNRGTVALREAWCRYRADHDGVAYDPDGEIIVTAGGMEAMYLALVATLDPGDDILVPDPGYANYFGQVRMVGANVVSVPLFADRGFRMRARDVEEAITPNTRVLLLNSPSNPTGAIIDPDELRAIADVVERHDLWVISDEVYRAFVYDDGVRCLSIATMPGMKDRTIVVDSFSKTFAMTGWRIGCAFGPKPIVDQMTIMQENVVSCVPGALQAGAVAALENGSDILPTMKAAYRTNRDMVVSAIADMPLVSCTMPDGAFYVLVDVSATGMDDHEFAVRLLHEGKVVVTPASGFGSRGRGFVRISYVGTAEDTAEGLRRMKAWLSAL